MPSRRIIELLAKAIGFPATELLKHDPREGLEDIVAAANADPQVRAAVINLCRGVHEGALARIFREIGIA